MGLVLLFDLHLLLGLYRLVQAVRISTSLQNTSGELVHYENLSVLGDDVVLVPVEELVGLQGLLDVMVEVRVLDIREVLDVEELLGLLRTLLGDGDGLRLSVYDVVPVLHLVQDLEKLVLGLLLFFVEIGLFLGGRILFGLLLVVVEAARKSLDEPVHVLIEPGALSAAPGYDERGPRLVYEYRVDLVYDAVVELALHHRGDGCLEVVTKIIEAELVVGRVENVALIRLSLLVVVHAGHDHAHREAEELVDFAHPFGVSLSEVFVDRDDVHAFAG